MSNENQNLSGWRRFIKKMTKANELGKEEDIMTDHDYDGIKELDNVLPPWWLYGFYITILISIYYIIMIFVSPENYNQELEYTNSVEQAKKDVAAWVEQDKKDHPEKYTEAVAYTDAANLAKGKELYTSKTCFACHLDDLGGSIGPNMTDDKWISGGGFKNIFNTITKGGRPGKGMVAWENSITKEERQQLASYIVSMQGTTPANPKAPEGDITWSGK
ncbi:MAG: c-type cytochrome [Flavobacteriaceae bacterium]|nr:c-type cytochrome [Flavobacteriaceae bacterium]